MTLFECINRGLENITNEVDTVWGRYNSSPLTESKADEQKLIDFAGEDLAKRFFALKPRLKSPENDLYYWLKKDLNEFEQFINDTENTKSKTQQKKSVGDGAKLVGENEYWKVYHITTFDASQKYGRDSKWCITGVDGYGDTYWKSYINKGIQFYFYITKGDYNPRGKDSKFAIAVYPNGKYEVYNQQDFMVKNIPNAPEINGIPYKPVEYAEVLNYSPVDGIPINIDTESVKKVIVSDKNNGIIPAQVFESWVNLETVELPDSIDTIDVGAFRFCDNLKNINFTSNLTSIESAAFYDCSSLKSIHLNSCDIGSWTFAKCSSLTDVKLSPFSKIGEYAFYKCTNLRDIDIPKGVLVLNTGTFGDCKSLEKVSLPDTLLEIQMYAFGHCSSLETLFIPDSVDYISKEAFMGCKKLTLQCHSGSYAEKYAKENYIPYEIV